MYARYFPFEGKNSAAILEMIRTQEPDLQLVDDQLVRSLLRRMLVKVPEERIDIGEIKMDPYFRGINF